MICDRGFKKNANGQIMLGNSRIMLGICQDIWWPEILGGTHSRRPPGFCWYETPQQLSGATFLVWRR